MHRFHLLGTIDLRDEADDEIKAVLSQPKRVALLAYLAVARPGGHHRRDSLLALFWPELDEERARNALSKGIHFLRQSLGQDAILTRTTDEVSVDPGLVWSDVEAFRKAVAEGRVDEALALYRGDLLPSFHISEAAGFERWLEGEREALRALAAAAAKTMAERLLSQRQITGAVAHAQRAVELSGQDERMLRRLLVLLESVGNRAAAVATYESFAQHLQEDFASVPAPETQALIARIRAAHSPAPGTGAPQPEHDSDPFDQLAAALSDRYLLERELGSGGSATVYLAKDLKLQRQVAIKVLRPSVAASVGTSRFLHEILIAAGLNHPHIVPLLDSGEAGGFVFYVMPWLTGESVRERLIREGPLPVAEAVRIAREVADALAYAHAHNVIHRDIKPENILLESGHAVVADFGIARAIGTAAVPRPGVPPAGSGTPAYVSPEQSVGSEPGDGRGDIYSLGCVLFEMLTGRPPFGGNSVGELLEQHRSASPPEVTTLRPGIPGNLGTTIAKALAKAPDDRYRLAEELSQALAGVNTSRRAPWRSFAGIGSVFAAIAVSAWLLYDASPRVTLLQRTNVALTPARETYPSLAPDGRTVAYSVDAYLEASLELRDAGATEAPRQLTPSARWSYRQPVHSPDGRSLLVVDTLGLSVVSLDGSGSPRLVVPSARSGSWSPDGTRIVAGGYALLSLHTIDGTRELVLAQGEMPHSPAWSPDGEWIAYVVGNSDFHLEGNIAASQLWLIPAAGGKARRLVTEGFSTSPAWLPGHRSILFIWNIEGGRDIYQLDLKRDGQPDGPPRRVTTGLDPERISISADGKRLAYSELTELSNIWALPRNPRNPLPLSQARRVTNGTRIIENFAISTDAQWLYFDSDHRGITHLFKTPLAGGLETQLTFGGSGDFQPRLTADGTLIAFHAQRGPGPDRDIFVIQATGGDPIRISTSPEEDANASISPRGLEIVWDQQANLDSTLWISRRRLDGSWSTPEPLLSGAPVVATGPTWSPDGQWIAFHGPEGLQVLSLPNGERRILLPADSGPATWPQWAPDSRSVYYDRTAPDGSFRIEQISIAGGSPRLIAYSDDPLRQEHRYGLVVFRDTIYFTLMDRRADIVVADLRID